MNISNHIFPDKTNFKAWLTLYNMQIVFTKADGTERVMNCTLRPEVLPEMKTKLNMEETVEGSSEVISVWDLDKQAWRSFKPSTVIKANIITGVI